MTKRMPFLPIVIVNNILEDVAELNNDSFIMCFEEIHSSDRHKKSNRHKKMKQCFKVNSRKHDNLNELIVRKMKELFTLFTIYVGDSVAAKAQAVCIKTTTVVCPGWLKEPDYTKEYNTFVMSYENNGLTEYCMIEISYSHEINRFTCERSDLFRSHWLIVGMDQPAPPVLPARVGEEFRGREFVIYAEDHPESEWAWNNALHINEYVVDCVECDDDV